jgi:hypothetical protein
MSTYAPKIENIKPIINDPSDAENTKPLQADEELEDLLEEIRASKYELLAAEPDWMGEQK